jgi:hypothetical protein
MLIGMQYLVEPVIDEAEEFVEHVCNSFYKKRAAERRSKVQLSAAVPLSAPESKLIYLEAVPTRWFTSLRAS